MSAPWPSAVHDGLRAQIGVAKHQPLAHGGHIGAVHHVVKAGVGRLQQGQHIVATDHRNARVPALGRQRRLHRLRRAHGVEPARVANELDPARLHQGPQAQQHGHHIAGITQSRVALPVFLQDGQGEFGQVVAGDVLHLAALNAGHHGLPVVAIKAQARTDAYGLRHGAILKPCDGTVMGDNP
jgi:hypothetical protein